MIECLLWDVVALVRDGLKSVRRLLKMQKLGDGTYPQNMRDMLQLRKVGLGLDGAQPVASTS